MAVVTLNAAVRTALGRQGAKRVRRQGLIPAILYGEQLENVNLEIGERDLKTALSTPAGRNVIIEVVREGAEMNRAVLREITRNPITRQILHIDLLRISENKPIHMMIPVVLVGESPAVKEGRGILDHSMRTLEIKCLPKDIPANIEVDVSELDVGRVIRVSDITVPDVELLDIPGRGGSGGCGAC
jgi:large subunit ribosomal protein L25